MIKKVAETHALKKAFGIAGLQSEYDFQVVNEKAIPIDTEGVDHDRVNYAYQLVQTSTYDDDQKSQLENELIDINNTQLEEMISNLQMNQLEGTDKPGYNQGDIHRQLDMQL